MNTLLDLSAILPTAFGFWNSKVLLTAVEMAVFTKLGHRHLSGASLGAELPLHPRAIADFFDALVAMIMGAMNGICRMNFELFAEKFDFSNYRTLCDVGGATGLLCIESAKRHSHLRCVSFDLPAVQSIARKHVAAAGWEDRIAAAGGDFFTDPLPKADVITMGMILHRWNLEKKMHLIRSAYEALPPGGAFVVIEALTNDARHENVQGLMMSPDMLIEFSDAFDSSGADFRGWCREAGFQRFEITPLAGRSSAAVAYK
ncbi:MAG: hypothetical protein KGQ89_05510 [Verrucomicrobia bacterium]|nr:hypothetical protein [Verrucomicrobiota bacterium]